MVVEKRCRCRQWFAPYEFGRGGRDDCSCAVPDEQAVVISGIIFDAFGTLVRIGQRTNPYRELMREGRRQGLALTSDTMHFAMTTNQPLDAAASQLGIALTPSKLNELSLVLETELSSIQPFPDAVEAIGLLRKAGFRIGICSNLAYPYGPIVKSFFPNLDGYAFSYQLGCVKPDPVLYQSVCNQMGVQPIHCLTGGVGRVLMIGDSRRCDRDGPRAAGIMGFHLERKPHGQIRDLNQFASLVLEQSMDI